VTCVVGVVGKKGVLLAGDTQGSTHWRKSDRSDGKTFQISPIMAVAYCGSYRLGQLLQYNLSAPQPRLGDDEYMWAVQSFIPSLRATLKEHGYMKVTNMVEELGNSAFLLAVRARLLYIEDDLQVGEEQLPYAAEGSGAEVAVGALSALIDEDAQTVDDRRLERVATKAIEAATMHTPFVGGRITSVRTVAYTDAEKKLARHVLKTAA
jgi:hypothetical protein